LCEYSVGATDPGIYSLDPYRAFVIGLDGLAIAVHSIIAGHDDEALEKAMQLQGELRIELWCGTPKVADVPAA
jgi:hypothetical protein